jgi:hypothetical protein
MCQRQQKKRTEHKTKHEREQEKPMTTYERVTRFS